MSNLDTPPVLRRKIGTPTNPLDQTGMSPAKALRISFARAAEKAAEMIASIVGFSELRQDLTEIAESLTDAQLIQTLKGPAGSTGLALWNMQSVSAFIEQLVTGRVVPSEAEDRLPTQTDAAIISGVLNNILVGLDAEIENVPGMPPVKGFRYAGQLDDGRAVSMALMDVSYRTYLLSLDLGNGAKKGELRLIFPWDMAGDDVAGKSGAAQWEKNWCAALQDAEAPVHAILHRLGMPLGEIAQLDVGTFIPVPTETIGAVSLEGFDHRAVATGRLGQSKGHRAVMVTSGKPVGRDNQNDAAFQNAQPSGSGTTPQTPEIAAAVGNETPHQATQDAIDISESVDGHADA